MEALGRVRNLTDVGTMTRLLHECIAYQRALDVDLDNLLAQSTDLDKHLLHLQKSAEVLDIIKADSDLMLSTVRCTFRELDLAQSWVNSTLLRIGAIVERGNCIEGAKNALEAEDYEAAAKYDSGLDQRDQLLASKKQLEGVVRKRLSAAVDQRDHRFIRSYPPLGLEEEGLQVYVGYLKKVISKRSRLEFEHLVELMEQSHNQINFVGRVTNLFKDIVLAIEENDENLSLCVEDAIVYAIRELQDECDSRGSLILKKYMEFRKLAKLSSKINAQNKDLLAVGTPEGPDPREVELYLEEILSLMQSGEDYTEFMTLKIKRLSSVDPELVPRATRSLRNGSFSKVVQDVTGKAIMIDEHVPDSLTTSMVDDVFCVLQSCFRRAISRSNISSVIAILSGATLQQKMREPNLGAKLILGGVLKLKHEIEEQCAEVFPASAEIEKVKSCLEYSRLATSSGELGNMSNTFKQTLIAGMEKLVLNVTPRIRPVLDNGVTTISYELSEAEYADNEVNIPSVQSLLHAIETNMSWLQPLMTSNNYDSFVHLVIDFIVKRLEVIMMQKMLNQLGGLQLDRDTRALVSHFSSMTGRTVRDKFARLTQIATILNLEKASEILNFWVLGLRVDFKPEAIAALKL
ncbi:hypothetical protein MANES_05G016350v8 [Manihot esculenta]|uniref:Uncharacterized protein n=1 Tax=Manihot esculenta TaxID=3983 RepID=A0ACB7HLB2_MANES|nr:hypothetical protein MANES_05G016350v8 [Manihot esculenta]